MLPTVFDEYGLKRLLRWRQFRELLETSSNPLQQVVDFWKLAPFVSPYLDPKVPQDWPDPWHLILDLRLDNLAIVLGMLYTIKLTQRFIDTKCEIHMSMPFKNTDPHYILIVDNKFVLNYNYGAVIDKKTVSKIKTKRIYSVDRLQ